MRYNPKNPDWYADSKTNEEICLFYCRLNRDRFILNAGHARLGNTSTFTLQVMMHGLWMPSSNTTTPTLV